MKIQITPIAETAEKGAVAKYRGVDLKIARANNMKFKRIFRELTKPYKELIDKDRLDEDTSRTIYLECLAEAVLIGWRNFYVGEEEVPYSTENAIELLRNDPDCLEFVTNFSQDIENYLIEDEAELREKL